MPNELTLLVERGLDPTGYEPPVSLALIEGDLHHHGKELCSAGIPTQWARVSPLEVKHLCSRCWASSLPLTPQGDQLARGFELGQELMDHERTLVSLQECDFLLGLMATKGILRRLPVHGSCPPLDAWADDLRQRTLKCQGDLRDLLSSAASRRTLHAWCGSLGYAPTDILGEEIAHLYREGRDVGLVRSLWQIYAESLTSSESTDLIEKFAQAMISHGDWAQAETSRLDFTPTTPPQPGDTMETYLLREWQKDVTSVAPALVAELTRRTAPDSLEDFELLGVKTQNLPRVDASQFNNPRRASDWMLHRIMEAWRIGEKDGWILLAVPSEITILLRRKLGSFAHTGRIPNLLTDQDTPVTLETALALWEPSGSGLFRSLYESLDAARRV